MASELSIAIIGTLSWNAGLSDLKAALTGAK